MDVINRKQFDELLPTHPVVLIDFYADWCGPCKQLAPVLEELAVELKGKVHFAKINIDEERSLAEEFGIMSIPTLLIFRHSEVSEQLIGFMPKEDIKKALDEVLKRK